MNWTPSLAVGVPELDAQHRELFVALDALVVALRSRTAAEVERRLTSLGDAVVAHFGDEERRMREEAYPGYDPHRAAHEELVREFARLVADLRRGGLSPAMAGGLQARVGRWLSDHIMGADHAFGRWLLARRAA